MCVTIEGFEAAVAFAQDTVSEHPERFFVGEIIREKIFQQYREEVPYCSSVGFHNPALNLCFCPVQTAFKATRSSGGMFMQSTAAELFMMMSAGALCRCRSQISRSAARGRT